MFGVIAKSLWQKTNPADEKNLIELGMRSLLMGTAKTHLSRLWFGEQTR